MLDSIPWKGPRRFNPLSTPASEASRTSRRGRLSIDEHGLSAILSTKERCSPLRVCKTQTPRGTPRISCLPPATRRSGCHTPTKSRKISRFKTCFPSFRRGSRLLQRSDPKVFQKYHRYLKTGFRRRSVSRWSNGVTPPFTNLVRRRRPGRSGSFSIPTHLRAPASDSPRSTKHRLLSPADWEGLKRGVLAFENNTRYLRSTAVEPDIVRFSSPKSGSRPPLIFYLSSDFPIAAFVSVHGRLPTSKQEVVKYRSAVKYRGEPQPALDLVEPSELSR